MINLDIGLKDIINKVASYIPNSNERHEMQHELENKITDYAQQIAIEQIKNNQIEATHKSVFVAGWRPFIGWVCGIGVAWAFVFQPFMSWFAVVLFQYTGSLPEPDILNLIALLGGMLGMGTLRTYEKKHGVNKR